MPLHPFAGLGSWAAFKATEHEAMVMGDTVVFQDEVSPAMDAAFANGLEVSALHNHFFFEEPKVYFMHIGGQGDPQKLAAAVKAVWDAAKAVRQEQREPAMKFAGDTPAGQNAISSGPIERMFKGAWPKRRTGWQRSQSLARGRCTASRSAGQWA